MNVLRPAFLALVCCAPLLASAQWLWLDKDGKKVFSDRPPPSDIAPNRILKEPGARGKPVDTAPVAAAPATAAPAATAALPAASGKDKGLEEKRKQAEAAEAERKKAEEAKVAAVRADSCNRAKASKASFDSGMRIARVNEKGEREILDDAQRAVEVKRLDGIISRDCVKAQ